MCTLKNQGSAIGPNSFSIYVAYLKDVGNTNLLCKYADDTSLIVPELCDVKIEDELSNITRWSIAAFNVGLCTALRPLGLHLVHVLVIC